MDLNLIAESLGGFVIEGRRRKKYRRRGGPSGEKPVQTGEKPTNPTGAQSGGRSKEGGSRTNTALGDLDDLSRRALDAAASDYKQLELPNMPKPTMGSRIRAALKDFRKRFTSPKGQPRSGGAQALGAITSLVTAPRVFQNLHVFNPKYKAEEDPTSPLYKKPEPEYKPVPGVVFGQRANEIGALGGGKPSSVPVKPPKLPKPVKLPVVEPKTSPDPEPQVDPSQDPAKKPKTKPPVVKTKDPKGNVVVGDDNKTGSKQGVTPLSQGQLSQIARGAATAQALKAATSKTGKGKFKFGVPQQARGRIGRRQNPQ
jgi:outer membrane biosynthesis protein TonB